MENKSRGHNGSKSDFEKSAERALDKASTSAHAVVDSMAEAADEVARTAKPAISKTAATAHQVVDKATDAVAPTAEWLAEQGDNLKSAQKKLVADTRSYVSGNPLKAIGIAVVAGFLLSRIVR